jgi:hypothetical protein
MSFSRPIQWYHSHAGPIWLDGTFNDCYKRNDAKYIFKIRTTVLYGQDGFVMIFSGEKNKRNWCSVLATQQEHIGKD